MVLRTMNQALIHRMVESDISDFVSLVDEAFAVTFKHLLGKAPPGRSVGERVSRRFHRPDCHILVLRDDVGRVRAALPLQRCGSRAVPGPLAIAPSWQEPWKQGIATLLVDKMLELAAELGCDAVDSVTFPHSVGHFRLYWQSGAPMHQALLVGRSVRRPGPRPTTARAGY